MVCCMLVYFFPKQSTFCSCLQCVHILHIFSRERMLQPIKELILSTHLNNPNSGYSYSYTSRPVFAKECEIFMHPIPISHCHFNPNFVTLKKSCWPGLFFWCLAKDGPWWLAPVTLHHDKSPDVLGHLWLLALNSMSVQEMSSSCRLEIRFIAHFLHSTFAWLLYLRHLEPTWYVSAGLNSIWLVISRWYSFPEA